VSVIDGVASEVPSTPSASVSSGTDLNTTLLTPDEVGLYVSNLAARDRGELAPLVREFAAMDASGAVAQDARIRFVNLFNIAGTARFHDTSATPDRFAISPLGARTIAATIDATRAAVYLNDGLPYTEQRDPSGDRCVQICAVGGYLIGGDMRANGNPGVCTN
jgi:hypothetical protein